MIRANPNVPYKTIISESLDRKRIREWREEWEEAPLSLITPKELDFLQYAPSTLFKINKTHQVDFPIGLSHQIRQFEGDGVAQYSVLDGAVMKGYYNSQIIRSIKLIL